MRWDHRARLCGRGPGGPPTMVTLITEKLQSQSLDDLAHQSCDAGPCSAEKRNRSGHVFPFETNGDGRPWQVLSGGWPLRSPAAMVPAPRFPPGPGSAADLRESLRESSAPLAPPSKRHCRSLSEPDELARCRSPWRPGGSTVWTAVSKRRCHSGGSASLPSGPGSPPAPRPASASSGCEGARPPGAPLGPALCCRRRLSLSQEHLLDADAPAAPALGWRLGLLRSRSQPCVLAGRKSCLKRPREEDPRWPRPSLDFLKMTRTLKNSKSLGSLDCEGEEEEEARAKTAASSPRAAHGRSGLATPTAGPRGACRSPWASQEGGSGREPGGWGRAGEEGVCPPGPGELDLEQIENN